MEMEVVYIRDFLNSCVKKQQHNFFKSRKGLALKNNWTKHDTLTDNIRATKENTLSQYNAICTCL